MKYLNHANVSTYACIVRLCAKRQTHKKLIKLFKQTTSVLALKIGRPSKVLIKRLRRS